MNENQRCAGRFSARAVFSGRPVYTKAVSYTHLLRISVITTKRAYEELEQEGFLETVTGKGSFVAARNTALIRESQLHLAQEHLEQAVSVAKSGGISLKELTEILKLLYEGE